eukprot:Lankesteria_metandrocarpae@DN1963_c0_g1_i1.p1
MALWKYLWFLVGIVQHTHQQQTGDYFQRLVDDRSAPKAYGCVASAWNDAIENDDMCVELLGTNKPDSTESKLTTFKDTLIRSPALPRDDYLFEQLDAEHVKGGNQGAMPTEILPFRDMRLLKMQMMDRNIVNYTSFENLRSTHSTGDSPKLLCGTYGGGEGVKSQYMIDSLSDIISMVTVDNETSMGFGTKLINSIKAAFNYWTHMPNLAQQRIEGEPLLQQIFDEIYTKAKKGEDVPSDAEASLLLARAEADNLRFVKAGNGVNFMLFRRSPRSRFQRYPFMSTLSSSSGKLNVAGSSLPAESYTLPIFSEDILLFLPDSVTDHLYTRELSSIVTRTMSPYDSESTHFLEKAVVGMRQHVPWKVPQHTVTLDDNPVSAGKRKHHAHILHESLEKLRFTTKPADIAKLLVLAATQQSTSTIPGPHKLSQFREGNADTKPHPACDAVAVACWVVPSHIKHLLESVWEGEFQPGKGHKSMVEALNDA